MLKFFFRTYFFSMLFLATCLTSFAAKADVVSAEVEWHAVHNTNIKGDDPVALCKSFNYGAIFISYLGIEHYKTIHISRNASGNIGGAECVDDYNNSAWLTYGCLIKYSNGTQMFEPVNSRAGRALCEKPRICIPTEGDPVDVDNQALVETADDWVSKKDSRFRIRRYYRSDPQLVNAQIVLNNVWFSGVWRNEYSDSIDENITNLAGRLYFKSDGTRINFNGTSPGSAKRNWHSYDIDVRKHGNYIIDYYITDGTGKRLHFTQIRQYDGLLADIEWNDGYRISFERNLNHGEQRRQVDAITDNRGQRAELTWSNTAAPNSSGWVVTKIDIDSNYDGTTFAPEVSISYTYAENSLSPSRPKIQTVTRTDIASGTTQDIWNYTYLAGDTGTDAQFPPALTSIRDGRTDSNGNPFDYATFTYQDPQVTDFGKVSQSGHSGGADTYTFDSATSVVTNSLGRQTSYTMTTVEGIKRVASVEGLPTASCLGTALNYDYTPGANEPVGFVYERTERNGSKTRYTRDSKGRVLTKTEDADGPAPRVTSYTWYGDFRLPLTRTTSQMSETFTYSPEGLLTQYTQTDILAGSPSNGQTRTWDYWYSTLPSGLKVLTLLDGPGLASDGVVDETTYTYDTYGNLLTSTDASGLITTITAMNAMGQPTQVNNPDGTKWVFTYDLLGRVTSSGFGAQAATVPTNTYTYDVVGQLLSITNTRGNTWTFTYDEARRLTKTTSPSGEVATYTHDAAGNITRTEYSDGANAATFWEDTQFDELSRLLKTVGANGQTWDFSYDVEDNLSTITDPTSLQTTQNFDALNRLVDVVDRAGFTSSNDYNDTDLRTKFTDQRSIETNFVYNGFGEVLSEVSADRGTINYTYNNRGLVTSMTDARGITVNYLYDNLGRVTKIDYPAGIIPDVRMYYDGSGSQNANFKAWNKGHLWRIFDSVAFTEFQYKNYLYGPQISVRYLYPGNQRYNIYEGFDFEGNRKWLQYPKSNDRVYYDYDDDDRITRMRVKQGNTYTTIVDNITYLPNGPVASMIYGDGFAQTRTYDNSYRLTGINDSDGPVPLRDIVLGYTARDNLASVTDQLDALRNENFTYSTRELLTSANGAYGDLGFTYDGVGNRTSRSSTVAATTTTDTYNYLATDNRLASITGGTARTFTHDAAGNVTYDNRSGQGYGYTYDAANRMESFSINGVVQAEYKYNYLGQQAIRTLTQAGQVINSVYGPDGNRMAEFEYDPAAGTSTLLREYLWFEGQPIAVIEGGVVYYVRSDHIGRPVFATDATGAKVWEATYLPFGGVHTSTGNNINLRFPGQWFQSESGLHQNWMRDYDPTTGRYIEADPLGLIDGASVYGYARQNPGRYIDFHGLLTDVWNPGGGIGDIISGGIDVGLRVGGRLVGLTIGLILYPTAAGDGTITIPIPDWRTRKGDWRVNVRCHVKVFDDKLCESCPATIGGWAKGKTFSEAFSGAQMDANTNLGLIGGRGCHPRHCQPVACYYKGKRVACPKSGR